MRTRSLAPPLLLLGLLLAPAAQAQSLAITDIDPFDEEGTSLRLLPLSEVVVFRITVTNSGTNSTNGTFTFRFLFEAADGSNQTANLRTSLSVPAGGSSTVDFDWAAAGRKLGEYTVTLEVLEVPGSAVRTTFRIAETAVHSGNLVDRIIDYAWFFASFAFVMVLFIVVLAARRR